jgi:hypothetical protein
MTPDDLVWEQAEEIFDKWLLQFLQHDVLRPIGAFIITHERGFGTEIDILTKGSTLTRGFWTYEGSRGSRDMEREIGPIG